jgi:hypothetical protein
MKTEIIIKTGWEIIAKYDFLITMSKGDVVDHDGREYEVDCSMLMIHENKMLILLDQ